MKPRIIFMCGPDRCGKTEIGKALSKKLGIPYFKASREHDSYRLSSGMQRMFPTTLTLEQQRLFHEKNDRTPFMYQLMFADPRTLDLFGQCQYSAVFDRGFPCELVYAEVFGRKTDEQMIQRLDEGWAALGAKIIIAHRTSYDGIVDDLDKRIDSQKLQILDAAYQGYLSKTKCSTLLLNVNDEDLKRQLNDIMHWLGD